MSALTSRAADGIGTAMIAAGVVTAQFIAGKAVRDALFLSQVDVSSLPAMVAVASAASLGLVALSSALLRRISPAEFVPLTFLASAILFVAEWFVALWTPRVAAPLVFLHVSGLGPILGSGFWLIATERFDAHTAKKRFGQIAGVGTLGGLGGGLLAERIGAGAGATAMLPALAVLNIVCAWQTRRLTRTVARTHAALATDAGAKLAPEPPRSGLRALAGAPHLRSLAALVLLGTIAAAPVDYLFKAQTVAELGQGPGLLRFFAIYYAVTSVITFAVQTWLSRAALEKIGLGFVAGTPSVALIAGAFGAMVVPGVASITVARAGESIFRSSLFRSGYELFYTPLPAKERRAAKSLIDVGVDRIGEILGAGVIRATILLASDVRAVLLGVAIVCSSLAFLVASRLTREYVEAIIRFIKRQPKVELDLSDIRDLTTRTVFLKTRGFSPSTSLRPTAAPAALSDPLLADTSSLRSRDRSRIVAILRRKEPLPAALVPHVIPLLAWDAVAEEAVTSLRRSSDAHVGAIGDALLDPNQPFAVRRRLPRTLSHCASQRAVDALVLGLDDLRFEVRFRCGRALVSIRERSRLVHIDRVRILDVVQRDVGASRPVWESHRLLDKVDHGGLVESPDRFVKDRPSESLVHVFTLLSLVLDAERLWLAYGGLCSQDQATRGAALEYLESVIPSAIWVKLWPFLDEDRSEELKRGGRS